MKKENIVPIPGYIKILGWLISLSAFCIGFWHTHLGLKEFRPLSWEYGSLIVSGLVLMVLIVAYERAISGVKYAILFYLLCATFMFIFNLNSFYPNFKGKQLIKEDASMLKDSLNKYTTKLNVISGQSNSNTYKNISDLKTLKKNIYTELTDPNYVNRVGNFVRGYFNKFKQISGTQSLDLGSISLSNFDPKTKIQTVDQLMLKLDTAILQYVVNQSPDAKNGIQVVEASLAMDELSKIYTDSLISISQDTTSLKSIESARKGKDVMMMVKIASEFDQIARKVNTAKKEKVLPIFNDLENNQVSVPYTQQLGLFSHTISAIAKHINKIDTWGIIILCFFIDFIVPLAIFFMLSNKGTIMETVKKTRATDFNKN